MNQDGCGGEDGVIAVQHNDEIALSPGPPQIQRSHLGLRHLTFARYRLPSN